MISMQQRYIILAKDESEINFEHKFKEKLSHLFTETQITQLLNKKKKVAKWNAEDISNIYSAISLRSVSPKAYRYLREKKQYPLPGAE